MYTVNAICGTKPISQVPRLSASEPAASSAPVPDALDYAADVPLAVARAAYGGTSMDPEMRADTARSEYAASLAADLKQFRREATKGGTLAQLDHQFASYREGCAKRYRAYLASSARCVSSFIAGPSNFPAARMNKRADIAHKRLTEFLDYQKRARSFIIRNLRPDLQPIRSSDDDALERLKREIAGAEQLQQMMRDCNTAIRREKKNGRQAQIDALVMIGAAPAQALKLLQPDFCGRIGFADYQLTNNSATIRRLHERLANVSATKAMPTTEAKGTAARIEDDPPANRVRLFFPGKPDDATRTTLKSRGFRWSPTLGAWQAYRNPPSLQIAQEIAGAAAIGVSAGARTSAES